MDVGQRLGLDALRRVDDEDRTFAGLQAVADLVGEVDVSGRVDEVEAVGQAVAAVYSRRTARALIVMPFSRSRSIESRTWLVIWRPSIVWVSSSSRSASVDLPWSMWAMIEKLRRRSWGMVTRRQCSGTVGRRPAGRASDLKCRKGGDADHDEDDADGLERDSRSPKNTNAATAAKAANWLPITAVIGMLSREPQAEHRSEDLAGSGDEHKRQRGPGDRIRRWERRAGTTTTTTPTRRADEGDPGDGHERGRLARCDESDTEDERRAIERMAARRVSASVGVVAVAVDGSAVSESAGFIDGVDDDVEIAGWHVRSGGSSVEARRRRR